LAPRTREALVPSSRGLSPVREPNGSLALHAHGAPGPFATPWGGALARPVPLRGLKRAFHPFARRPGFLHCALHLGLRSPRFFRLVSNLVILSSRNPSPVLLSTSRCLLGHRPSPFSLACTTRLKLIRLLASAPNLAPCRSSVCVSAWPRTGRAS
jgi:hypothetical protein